MRGQRGSIVAREDSYSTKYRGLNGKQKMCGSRPGHGFKTYEEAQKRLHEVLNDINKGQYIEPKKVTFEVFAETWLKERLSIRGGTDSSYGSMIKCHLIRSWGRSNSTG